MGALPQYKGQSRPDVYLTKLVQIGMQNGLTHRKRPKNMSPSDMRQYLTSLLVQNHQCDVEDAREIASYWVYGRGSDFYQYDLDTFKDMFGDEIGMLFFLYSRGLTPGGRLKDKHWKLWLFLAVCIFVLFSWNRHSGNFEEN
ncbi:uncharacterized protein EAE98_002617 [Botrytis deweyae]|uniref:Uncharacterized protein n=1 Tax=Botrytis deweyae TaxID=2478750 RepID=A0ABQ7IYM3_9HELO|nr:uncharacterized protein EAE98_002617 [Botrytis deweyae]KAF7931435.1 hypothetical protein EAE99_003906 [Botrytis elliptica]KAF7936398.1 hypothetical protein EAE98_002617 [Botrytis deweyae]